jgi:Protein of unknown function (DUF2946)
MNSSRVDVIMSGAQSRLAVIQVFRVFKRAAQQRFVAWLAFAAMALVVLMPAISRSMPTGMDMGSIGGMRADCPMGGGSADHRHGPAMPGDPGDPTARCAYCVLLSHNPVTGFASAVLWLRIEPLALTPQAAVARSVPAAPLLSARPRGPPLRING